MITAEDLSNYRFDKDFVIRGDWWFPEGSVKYPGLLTHRNQQFLLEINRLNPYNITSDINVINGESYENSKIKITLFANIFHSSQSGSGIDKCVFNPQFVLIGGDNFKQQSDVKIISAEVKFDNLLNWFNPYRKANKKKLNDAYKKIIYIPIQSNNELNLNLHFQLTNTNGARENIFSINESIEPKFSFFYTNPQNLRRILDDISIVSRFIGFALRDRNYESDISLETYSDVFVIGERYKILYSRVGEREPRFKDTDYFSQSLYQGHNLNIKTLQMMFKRWFDFRANFETLYNSFTDSIIYGYHEYFHDEFLSLCFIIDNICNEKFINKFKKKFCKNLYKSATKTIVNNLDLLFKEIPKNLKNKKDKIVDLKEHIKYTLERSNKVSTRELISKLFNNFKVIFKHFDPKFDTENAAKNIWDLRGSLAHGGIPEEKNTATIFKCKLLLRILIEAFILKELGLNNNRIANMLINVKEYQTNLPNTSLKIIDLDLP